MIAQLIFGHLDVALPSWFTVRNHTFKNNKTFLCTFKKDKYLKASTASHCHQMKIKINLKKLINSTSFTKLIKLLAYLTVIYHSFTTKKLLSIKSNIFPMNIKASACFWNRSTLWPLIKFLRFWDKC